MDLTSIVATIEIKIRVLRRDLYLTPKWRAYRRWRLFERIDKLEEDADLIAHVMMHNDDGELDHQVVIGDLRRIAAWLAKDTDNQEAQGAASDLLTAASWVERSQ